MKILRGRVIHLLALVAWMAGLWELLVWSKSWRFTGPPSAGTVVTTQIEWPRFFATYVFPNLPEADGMVTPMCPPDGDGATVTLPFLTEQHLGEDWATAPGNGTQGQPVYSVADGWVSVARDFQNGWGKVVMICYRMPAGRWPPVMEIMYAQLGTVDVAPGDFVKKGQKIGTVGVVMVGSTVLNMPHLHWEVRQAVDLGPGGGFSEHRDGWLSPTEQLQAHRGVRATDPLKMKVLDEKDRSLWGNDL